MSAWVRRLVTLACVLAAWLVVRPAAASAPVCDDRAASALAPDPVLDAGSSTLDVGEHDSGCEAWLARGHAYKRGEQPAQVWPSARPDFVPSSVTCHVAPPVAGDAMQWATVSLERAGVRFLPERPPRA